MSIVAAAAMIANPMKIFCCPTRTAKGQKTALTQKFVSQLSVRPSEPVAAALWLGTTSGIRRKGMGPRPSEKDATKEMTAMLAMMGELLMENARMSEKRLMHPTDSRRSGLLPMRWRERLFSWLV